MQILLLILLIFVSCGKSNSQTGSENTLQGLSRQYNLPALAGVTIQNNQIKEETFSGIRRVGESAPITSEDAFHLGSCSKAMTATLAAILIDENKLQWNQSLSSLLPDLELHSAFNDLPFDLLLVHRAGITGEDDVLFQKLHALSGVIGKELILGEILTRPPLFAPGSMSVYSNYGYIIAGRILERLSGKTFEVLMREKLFTPLGMSSCGFGPAPQVSGHIKSGGMYVPVSGDNPEAFSPAGRVHCNLKDWGKFLSMLLNGWNGKSTFLSASSFNKLQSTYHASDSDFSYGGWKIVDRSWAKGKAFTHTGSNTANYANAWLAPEINSVFMSVTNAGGDEAFKATDSTIGNMIRAYQAN